MRFFRRGVGAFCLRGVLAGGGGVLQEGVFGRRVFFCRSGVLAGGWFWSEGGFVRRGVLSCSLFDCRQDIFELNHLESYMPIIIILKIKVFNALISKYFNQCNDILYCEIDKVHLFHLNTVK